MSRFFRSVSRRLQKKVRKKEERMVKAERGEGRKTWEEVGRWLENVIEQRKDKTGWEEGRSGASGFSLAK